MKKLLFILFTIVSATAFGQSKIFTDQLPDSVKVKSLQAGTSGYVVTDVALGDSRTVPYLTPTAQGWATIVTSSLRHNLINHAQIGRTVINGGSNSIAGNLGDIPTYSASYGYLFINAKTNDINGDTTVYTYAAFGSALRTIFTNAITTKSWAANNVKFINTYFVPGATSAWGTAYRQKRFADTVRAVCAAYGIQCIDAEAAEKAQYAFTLGKTQKDGIHESPDGHSWLANFILARLNNYNMPNAGQAGAINGQLDAVNIRVSKGDTLVTGKTISPLAITEDGNIVRVAKYTFTQISLLSDTAKTGGIYQTGGIAGTTVTATGNAEFPKSGVQGVNTWYYAPSNMGHITSGNVLDGTTKDLTIEAAHLYYTGLFSPTTLNVTGVTLPASGTRGFNPFYNANKTFMVSGNFNDNVFNPFDFYGQIELLTAPTANSGTTWKGIVRDVSTGALQSKDIPVVISTITGINAKTTGATALYAVPTGKTVTVTGAIIKCTASLGITVGPTIDIGVTAGDIYASTALTTLVNSGQAWAFSTGGLFSLSAGTTTINLNINTAATGTSQTLTVELIGYIQ